MIHWNSTKTYTEEDILRMQQEAVSRVHEFQARAQEFTSSYYDVPIGQAHPPVIEAQSRVVDSPSDPPQHSPAPGPAEHAIQPAAPSLLDADPIKGLLERFNLDSETLLILGLIVVLYNEKADNVLLMALAYLLL